MKLKELEGNVKLKPSVECNIFPIPWSIENDLSLPVSSDRNFGTLVGRGDL
jgi:hypothetical protein